MRLTVLLLLLVCVTDVSAQGRRWRRQQWQPVQTRNQNTPVAQLPSLPTGEECKDALAEVNAHRSQRGLPPFKHDPLLTQAAYACAKERASKGIHGHLISDFAHLPPGAQATSAGCGAWFPGEGWGTCCAEDPYTFAGAAWVIGACGRRYMHLFVR